MANDSYTASGTPAGVWRGLARPGAGVPAWLDGVALWQWIDIPNTPLSSVAPTPTPPGINGPQSKITAWCGATLKRAGSVYMLGAAGGHGDYAGNEVNALALNTDAPAWATLRAPTSPSSLMYDGPAQFYGDFRPAATHTYWATQFHEGLNTMFVMPSDGLAGATGTLPPEGWAYTGRSRVYAFDYAASDWKLVNSSGYYDAYPLGDAGDFVGAIVAKHPTTEDIYYSRGSGGGWYRFRPTAAAGSQWTQLSTVFRTPWYAVACIDPTRDRMLTFGGFGAFPDGNSVPIVRNLDGTTISATFGGLGPNVLTVNGYPGCVWDEVNQNFLAFINTAPSITVYRVNPSTWAVDAPSITGSAAQRSNGIHNSVQYVPELRGVVFVNNYNGNAKFMRTSI